MNTDTSPGKPVGRYRAVLTGVAVFAFLALSACNTTEGMGKDIENLGDNIEDAARDAKSPDGAEK